MTNGRSAWRLAMVGLVGLLALPVCAAKKAVPAADLGPGRPSPSAPILDAKKPAAPSAASQTDRSAARKAITRQPGETPEQLGARVLPRGARTIIQPLEFDLRPLGRVVLVLFELDSDDATAVADPSIYRGLVLVPDAKAATYRIEPLPSQAAGFGTLMYDVKSVFAADADGDGNAELCVLSEIAEVGAGDSGRPHTDTDMFKWTGAAFTLVPQSDQRPLYNLRDAKAVRARLKKLLGP